MRYYAAQILTVKRQVLVRVNLNLVALKVNLEMVIVNVNASVILDQSVSLALDLTTCIHLLFALVMAHARRLTLKESTNN